MERSVGRFGIGTLEKEVQVFHYDIKDIITLNEGSIA